MVADAEIAEILRTVRGTASDITVLRATCENTVAALAGEPATLENCDLEYMASSEEDKDNQFEFNKFDSTDGSFCDDLYCYTMQQGYYDCDYINKFLQESHSLCDDLFS